MACAVCAGARGALGQTCIARAVWRARLGSCARTFLDSYKKALRPEKVGTARVPGQRSATGTRRLGGVTTAHYGRTMPNRPIRKPVPARKKAPRKASRTRRKPYCEPGKPLTADEFEAAVLDTLRANGLRPE